MSERMEYTFKLAAMNWDRAYRVSPTFVKRYLYTMKTFLERVEFVKGDDIKDIVIAHGVKLPLDLHHNTWASGVNQLRQLGWIEPVQYVEPTQGHNHMPQVNLWRSTLYLGRKQ